MAETESKVDAATFESRLTALEKSVAALGNTQRENSRKLNALTGGVSTSAEMLREILDLTRRAAPLLDSPMARMAQSPAGAGLMNLVGKVQRHGR